MANIAILNYCNLQCPYCFANRFITEEEKQLITDEQLDTILNFLSHSTFGRIGIIGGEPTIHPQFGDILTKTKEFAAQQKANVTVFSNGILLGDYAKLFLDNATVLINVNHPDIVGNENWNKIKLSIKRLKAVGALEHTSIGINLYPDMIDYNYIIELAKEFKFKSVRCSYVAPTCDYSGVDKDDYYNTAKETFLDFAKLAKDNHVEIRLDCNNVPVCYYTSEELALINENVTGWKYTCRPVVDIMPDMKGTACFGAYELVDLTQFENLQEAENYFLLAKMYAKQLKNVSNKCKNCAKFNNLSCQGGCLAFANKNV